MIAVPTAWWAHYIGDAAAWACAALAARWQHRQRPAGLEQLARITEPGYFIALALGAVAGAWLIGSANSLRALSFAPSHSVAGALAGAIAGVELWKWRHKVTGSTGGNFVLPLAIGIAVGRLGCFFSGLSDYTYGTPTDLPWAVDFGDGIGRHPVQLYEAAMLALFAAIQIKRIARADPAHPPAGFQTLVIFYALQRFAWEFLKPYPKLSGSLNLFHIVAAGLLVYGLTWPRLTRSAPR